MKNLSILILMLFTSISTVFCQDSLSTEILQQQKLAWQWNFGLGYRQTNLNSVSERLFQGSTVKFDNAYVTGQIGFGAVLVERIYLGLEAGAMVVPNLISGNATNYYLGGFSSGLKAGYKIIQTDKFHLSLGYGFEGDYNTLMLHNKNGGSNNFEDAIHSPLTTSVSSINSTHRFALKLDFITSVKNNGISKIQNALGLEFGYILAGTNEWNDFNLNVITGPKIDNSGIFARVVYSFQKGKL